ncbi:MAG TPA: S-adenosylmethionine decarboxylase [Candidatus Paceibacterota bacterium]|nr:S-adenosylmethionine decarboxylase [Candidatus Paceibacterota bacterium]
MEENIPLEELERYFDQNQSWGLASGIDLHGCNSDYVRSESKIKEFVVALCDLIKMKRFGDCVVVDFGEDPRVSGFSMTQLIETSLISGHFVNQNNDIHLDIFSCKYYDPKIAAEFAANFFQATDYTYYYKIRK